jgi:hypothetical protein
MVLPEVGRIGFPVADAGHAGFGHCLEWFIKAAAGMENRWGAFARFWTAAARCRFFTAARAPQSGSGPPPSKTLARDSTAEAFLAATGFLKTL